MRYRVNFIAGNQRQTEEVYANSPSEAKKVIEARNPNAKVTTVTC